MPSSSVMSNQRARRLGQRCSMRRRGGNGQIPCTPDPAVGHGEQLSAWPSRAAQRRPHPAPILIPVFVVCISCRRIRSLAMASRRWLGHVRVARRRPRLAAIPTRTVVLVSSSRRSSRCGWPANHRRRGILAFSSSPTTSSFGSNPFSSSSSSPMSAW
jgi:hypothetical protein